MSDLNKNPDELTPEQLRDIRTKLETGGSDSTALGPAIYGGESDNDRNKNLHHHTESHESRDQRNFDQKLYFFPESFNQLRIELQQNWPVLWALVQWRMANRAEEFIEHMNQATDLKLVLDGDKVDFICTQYLKKLRQMRGLSQ